MLGSQTSGAGQSESLLQELTEASMFPSRTAHAAVPWELLVVALVHASIGMPLARATMIASHRSEFCRDRLIGMRLPPLHYGSSARSSGG